MILVGYFRVMSSSTDVFFHVGLGKVASTFLQRRFFSKLQGIHYVPTSSYKRALQLIPKLEEDKVLVSREFDRQFEREVRKFTAAYPAAGIIIIFRRHDDWIASQYKRHVKNGFYHDFDRFLDMKHDAGRWKQADLLYYPRLQLISRCSSKQPLVLFYDELVHSPWSFLDKIAAYTNTTYNRSDISISKVHTSFTEKQLRFLKRFCARYVRKVPKGYQKPWKHWLYYKPYWVLFHLLMYVSKLLPEQGNGRLIDEEQLKEVRDAYREDWNQVKEYAAKHNPV